MWYIKHYLQRRGYDWRWWCVREQVRAGDVPEQSDELARARGVAARRAAHRLAQRRADDVRRARHTAVLFCSPSTSCIITVTFSP